MTCIDREEVREQADRLADANATLKAALEDLATEAHKQARARQVDVALVRGLFRTVERAEEAVDIAGLDLATARGEDA